MNIVNRIERIFRITAFCFIIPLLLVACSRRDQFRPTDTDAPTGEQTTVAGQTDGSNPNETTPNGGEVTGPNTTTPPDIPIVTPPVSGGENGKITGNPYEGWTAEELYASFMEDQERSVYNNVNDMFGNTPYYVILDVRDGGSMFSKLTGQVVKICKDPICDHKTCMFNNLTSMRSCQVVDDRCYLAVKAYKENVFTCTLYSFDLLMNGAQLIYEWKGADIPDEIYVYRDKIYYDAEIKFDDGQYGNVTMVYDMKEKTTLPLRVAPVRCKAIWHKGIYEWYTAWEDGALWRHNLDTGEDEEIISSSLLNSENGETGFRFVGMSGQTVYIDKFTLVESTNILRYDLETDELLELESHTLFIYDDTFYQVVRHDTEDYKKDPHYDYYCNSTARQTCWGGKFYRTDEKTGDLHEVVNLRTDGIPDSLTDFFLLDGKFLMIEYQTYKDFKNPYSPSISEWAKSKRYVVVNLETGIVYELGVDLSNQSVHNRNNR